MPKRYHQAMDGVYLFANVMLVSYDCFGWKTVVSAYEILFHEDMYVIFYVMSVMTLSIGAVGVKLYTTMK